MPLTELEVRAAKPAEKPYKLFDAKGLFIQVTPSGGKLWRLRFKWQGKEKLLALGGYPEIGLQNARRLRDAAHEKLEAGIDPAAEKQTQKAAAAEAKVMTFKRLATAWFENRKHEWTPAYAVQIWNRLEDDIFAEIGELAAASIEPPQMLAALKKVEARGVLETTRRLKQYCSSIFRYGIAAGHCKHDPAAQRGAEGAAETATSQGARP